MKYINMRIMIITSKAMKAFVPRDIPLPLRDILFFVPADLDAAESLNHNFTSLLLLGHVQTTALADFE
jgi:hypothetical protein